MKGVGFHRRSEYSIDTQTRSVRVVSTCMASVDQRHENVYILGGYIPSTIAHEDYVHPITRNMQFIYKEYLDQYHGARHAYTMICEVQDSSLCLLQSVADL